MESRLLNPLLKKKNNHLRSHTQNGGILTFWSAVPSILGGSFAGRTDTWLITMVIVYKSPKDPVIPLPNGVFYGWNTWGWSDHHVSKSWEPILQVRPSYVREIETSRLIQPEFYGRVPYLQNRILWWYAFLLRICMWETKMDPNLAPTKSVWHLKNSWNSVVTPDVSMFLVLLSSLLCCEEIRFTSPLTPFSDSSNIKAFAL